MSKEWVPDWLENHHSFLLLFTLGWLVNENVFKYRYVLLHGFSVSCLEDINIEMQGWFGRERKVISSILSTIPMPSLYWPCYNPDACNMLIFLGDACSIMRSEAPNQKGIVLPVKRWWENSSSHLTCSGRIRSLHSGWFCENTLTVFLGLSLSVILQPCSVHWFAASLVWLQFGLWWSMFIHKSSQELHTSVDPYICLLLHRVSFL